MLLSTMSSTTQQAHHLSHPHHLHHSQNQYSSQYASQYLQVPKFAQTRSSRSRSKSRSRQRDSLPREVFSSPSPSQVIVSPQKLSFRPRSPEPPKRLNFKPEPDYKPVPTIVASDVENSVAETTTKPQPQSPPVSRVERVDSVTAGSNMDPTPSTRNTMIPTKPLADTAINKTQPIALLEDPLGSTTYDDLEEEKKIYTYGVATTAEPLTTPVLLPAPTPIIPLSEKLVGAWKLESYIAYPTPSSRVQRPTYPMTRNVTGFIMYTPDGYMSAQMLIPGQQSFKRGEGEEPQWAEAGKRCFAYCGPYYITDEGPGRSEILRHTFQCCNLPGWIGDIQVRTHRFEEDGQVLVLGSEEPTEVKGDKRIPVLKWRRVRNNADSKPPPPTPQIKISGPGEP